ncbi:MAG: phosphatidylserine decarboxylase family protein [Bacteroidales bacterium]|nr:phosphatidylserine decarboxylase family protein [Bacteroidales bacterium]
MVRRLNRLKKNIHLHSEGNRTLVLAGIVFAVLCVSMGWVFGFHSPWFIVTAILSVSIYLIIVNFFRCPVRLFEGPTEGVIVAPCDGKVVVVEEVQENEYFHDRRLQVSIFMSLFNVHANWVPADGTVKTVTHQNGRFQAAWLPKASTDNERSTIVIVTPEDDEILVRQIAGAMARRIVTYSAEGEDCFIDEHLGFIKFGSRVDLFLPIGTKPLVQVGQSTTGNKTVIAQLG